MSLPVLHELEHNQPHDSRSRHKKNQPVFPKGIEYVTDQGSCRRTQRAYQVNPIQITQVRVIGYYRDQCSDRSDDGKDKDADSDLRDSER